MVKRAALYLRVSTLDQKPSTRLYDLRGLAEQRGFEIVHEYSDHGFSGARVRRPALDEMLVDAVGDSSMSWWCGRVTAGHVPHGIFSKCWTNSAISTSSSSASVSNWIRDRKSACGQSV